MADNRNKNEAIRQFLQKVQDAFGNDPAMAGERRRVLARFAAASDIWKSLDPEKALKSLAGTKDARQFLQDLAKAPDPAEALRREADRQAKADEAPQDAPVDAPETAEAPAEAGEPFKETPLENIPEENPLRRARPAIVEKQAQVAPDMFRKRAESRSRRISSSMPKARQDATAASIVTREALRLHAAQFSERYAPGQKLRPDEVLARRAMIETMAPRMPRFAAASSLVSQESFGSAQERENRMAVLTAMSDQDFMQELQNAGEDRGKAAIQAASEWSDPAESAAKLASMGQRELGSLFAQAPVQTKREAAGLYSVVKFKAENEIAAASPELGQQVARFRRDQGGSLAPLRGGRAELAKDLGEIATRDFAKNRRRAATDAGAYLASAGKRYGVDPNSIVSGEQLTGVMRRASAIELLNGGLVGQERAANTAKLSGLSDRQLSERLAAAGFDAKDMVAMEVSLEGAGRALSQERLAAEREQAEADKRENSLRREAGVTSFASALQQAGMHIRIENVPIRRKGERKPPAAVQRSPLEHDREAAADLVSTAVAASSARISATAVPRERDLMDQGPDIRLPAAGTKPATGAQAGPEPLALANATLMPIPTAERPHPGLSYGPHRTAEEAAPRQNQDERNQVNARLDRLEHFALSVSNGAYGSQV